VKYRSPRIHILHDLVILQNYEGMFKKFFEPC